MDDLFLLSKAQMRRIAPFFPLSHGIPRVDDRRVISGIVFVIKNRLRWRDAPAAYGPHKTIYNRFICWSRMGVFNRIFAELAGQAGQAGEPDRIMIGHLRGLHDEVAEQTQCGGIRGRGCDVAHHLVDQFLRWAAARHRSSANGMRTRKEHKVGL